MRALLLFMILFCAASAVGQSTVNSTIAKQSDPSAATPSNATVSNLHDLKDRGCIGGKRRRDSALCAQWDTADSARRSVDVAERQMYWGMAGFFALVVTLLASAWAARASTRAALAAERSVAISEEVSRLQLRAYLSVRPVEIDDL